MSVVINGTTGITSPSPFVLEGSTSGTVTVAAPAVAGTNTQTLVAVTDTLAPVVRATAVTASGTSVDFTGIPSWVKRITVIYNGLSSNGTSNFQLQLGTTSTPTYTTSGYSSSCSTTGNTNSGTITSGLIVHNLVGAADLMTGIATLTNQTGNTWVCSGSGTTIGGAGRVFSGSLALGAVLTAVRFTTVNGTDTFDAGTINILYE